MEYLKKIKMLKTNKSGTFQNFINYCFNKLQAITFINIQDNLKNTFERIEILILSTDFNYLPLNNNYKERNVIFR